MVLLGYKNLITFEKYYNQLNQVEMNIEKSKTIEIKEILGRMNFFPSHTKRNDLWYKSPFSVNEKTASFKVCENKWYCHSSGFGGFALDLIIKLNNCSVSEALFYLSTNSFSFQKQEKKVEEKEIKQYEILEIKTEIENQSLIKYLNSRNIFKWDSSIVEIYYTLNQRNYFAIGFKNDQFGYDIRNQFFKGCLLKKAPTTIKNNANIITVFEGFFCYLTYINSEKQISDFIILNSVSNLKKCINQLADFEKIHLYLDNDLQGQKATEEVLKSFPNAIDFRFKYKNHKDLNDFFTGKQSTQS